MKKPLKIFAQLLGIALTVALTLATAVVVYAQTDSAAPDKGPRLSVLKLTLPEPLPIGAQADVFVQLSNEEGRVQPNKPILLYVDGRALRRARTDDQGEVTIHISQDLALGTHTVTAVYKGTRAYLPAEASGQLTIRPIQLQIETIPPLPGIQFRVDDTIHTVAKDGIAYIPLDTPGDHSIAILPIPTALTGRYTRIEFSRWSDSAFSPTRDINLSDDSYIQVGFILSHQISQRFIDRDGRPVDGSRISSLTFKSSHGMIYTFPDAGLHWLQKNRIARRQTGLEVTPVQYSLESVIIDGANAVNRYQQRFYVDPNQPTWKVNLLLFYARVQARDAIFGFPVGSGIRLIYPSERSEQLTFDASREIFIGPLARGIYRLQVTDVRGMAPVTPVALSRDQEVELKVLTSLDLGLGAVLGVVGALGLLLYGRPQIKRTIWQMGVVTVRWVGNRQRPLPQFSFPFFQTRRLRRLPLPADSRKRHST